MAHNLAVFGAFDINSLGDMLFPKALEIELGKRIESINLVLFSPTNIRSEYGNNYCIYPYDEFEEVHSKYSFDAIIIGGGELLHNRDIQFRDMEGHSMVYPGGRIWRFPIEMGKKHNIKILINSVGMPHDIPAEDKQLLGTLDYISFRDKYSQNRFYGTQFCGNKNLVPDSLWNLDEYFSAINAQNADKSIGATVGLARDEKYAVLQLGTLDHWREILGCVLDYCQENNLKLVVLAIN